ncbi:hypothetical protein BDV59DRAFT_197021 [Aspergillus ambiguus]|uniref:uncharacterized protein n=1 Tax=Aspergillus ambiguus TaxID=176160 RepID=UPI003CCDFF9C
MRWTPENVQKLFHTICETQSLIINVETVAQNWPAATDEDSEAAPSAKAIKEFLGKYKKTMKPWATLNISFNTKDVPGTSSAASTPRKRKASAKGSSSSAKQAKTSAKESEGEDEE